MTSLYNRLVIQLVFSQQNLEPVDIERNFDTATLADIECYENFVMQRVSPGDSPPTVQPPPALRDPIKAARAICAPPYKYVYCYLLPTSPQSVSSVHDVSRHS